VTLVVVPLDLPSLSPWIS